MANLNIQINSKFKPFSYSEMLAPVLMATQAHQQLEDTYGALSEKANVWEGMANEQTDPNTYKMYKTYANDLREQANLLASEGLTPTSRQSMLNMKSRYSKEITPIENAYKKREEDIARQKKVADATGGRTVFTRDARTTSLDKYMQGIDDYGQTNLDELYKEGAAGGAAISKRYLSTKEGQLFNNMYLNLQRTTGMSNAQVQQFLSNQRDANGNLLFPELHTLKNELLSKSNYQNYSVADQNRMEQAVLSGINSGIVYNVEDKPMENWRAKMATQFEYDKRKMRYAKSLENPEPAEGPTFAPRIFEGAEGEVTKDDRLKGFRRAGSQSFTTDRLHNAAVRLKKAENALKNSGITAKEMHDIQVYELNKSRQTGRAVSTGSGYAKLGAAMSGNVGVPHNYGKYKNLLKERQEARAAYDTEKKYVAGVYNKYKHLGNTMYDAVNIGRTLDNLQQKQESSSFTLNAKEPDYKNITAGISNTLGSFTKGALNSKNVGLVDRKSGKGLDYGDVQDIRKQLDSGEAKVKVKGGRNPEFVIVSNGKEYSFKGIEQITKFNSDLKHVNSYLSDFSKGRGTRLSSNEAARLAKSTHLSPSTTKPIGNSNYRGATFNTADGDIIKVMTDNSGRIVGINTLGSELAGGQTRDSYFINMANQGLQGLSSLFAK